MATLTTKTFLLTDIEGSTRLWESHPEAMREALTRHDQLIRTQVNNHGGEVFKTVGDGAFAVFEEAHPAIGAAIALQQVLQSQSWPGGLTLRVRMAIHQGWVEAREGDFFGPTLNRAARLLATGHGEQVLLSANIHAGTTAETKKLGRFHLTGLKEPETIYQLVHPHLRAEFPPLRTQPSEEIVIVLPKEPTPMIGREKEQKAIDDLLQSHALITLVGAGGCGKSRLALAAAHRTPDWIEAGIWWVSLADLSDPDQLWTWIARVLPKSEGQDPRLSIENNLKHRPALLVLDNCEHLIDAVADVTTDLLAACPNLKIIATSREPLGTAQEKVIRVPSLSTPAHQDSLTADQANQFESIKLFADRAVARDSAFIITNENAAEVARLCQRLDGIPLAIELAAARMGTLALPEILERLDDRFKLLTGGSRHSVARQQTLKAVFDWSFELLSPQHQTLFARLSVFVGGWTLEDATQLCHDWDEYEVLDGIETLVTKSLVQQQLFGGRTRFSFLESARQYALDILQNSGQIAELRDRHAEVFLQLIREAQPQLSGGQQVRWLDRLEAEIDNLQAAREHLLRQAHRLGDALDFPAILWRLWAMRGYASEGAVVVKGVLATVPAHVEPLKRAAVLRGLGWMQVMTGATKDNVAPAQEALQIAIEQRDSQAEANALSLLGSITDWRGEYGEALDYFIRTLAIHEPTGHQPSIGRDVQNIGMTLLAMGNLNAAEPYLQRSQQFFAALGEPFGEAYALYSLSQLAMEKGDSQTAVDLMRRSLKIRQETGERRGEGYSQVGLARHHLVMNQPDEATGYLRDGFKIFSEIKERGGLVYCTLYASLLSLNRADPGRAARILGASLGLAKTVDLHLNAQEQQLRLKIESMGAEAIGPAGWQAQQEFGETMRFDEVEEELLDLVHQPPA